MASLFILQRGGTFWRRSGSPLSRSLFFSNNYWLPRYCYTTVTTSNAETAPFPYQRVHQSVLLEEVIGYLAPQNGKIYLDGTFGEGGYTKRILDSANCRVIAVDQDPSAIEKAHQLANIYPGRLSAVWQRFGDIAKLRQPFDGIVLDVGLSSSQIASNRGFSFQKDALLDMRMSYTDEHGALCRLIPAHTIINQYSRDKLASIFTKLGQERFAKNIAAEIEKRRATSPINTTRQLVDVIMTAVPKRYAHHSQIHPATRVFQSLRIYVNDELGQLRSALESAVQMLNVGGRLVVVSFHSLEDSIVKKFFRDLAGQTSTSYIDDNDYIEEEGEASIADTLRSFNLLTKRALKASSTEIECNPRSRSARLRALERLE
ncbi:ribosomal RNA small subunit methyltransferase H [Coemansia spiralis]|nr:ribosomal RNA small subunit methyltransferase H [Coemansia spiralis]